MGHDKRPGESRLLPKIGTLLITRDSASIAD